MNRTIRSGLMAVISAMLVAAPATAQDGAPASLGNLKPRPAEIARLATQSLLLGVVRAGDMLVAVGDRGTIMRSPDGKLWTQVAVPVHATLTAVDFADTAQGWAVGHDGAILHTDNGGASWTLQRYDAAQNQPLLDVVALDTTHALAVGAYGLMLATADGGQTWAPVNAPALLEEGLHLNAAIRLGNGALLVVGETGLLGFSTDAGASWKRMPSSYDGSMFGALPVGQSGALVFGLRGNVLRTEDVQGGYWTRVDLGSVQSIYGGAQMENGTTVLVGADGAVFLIAPDGTVQRRQYEVDAGALGGGSLSGVLPWQQDLLLIGEAGPALAQVAGLKT
ncbi:MAG: YCF48-related protein, partial [Sinimarinibacterium sp.]